MIFKLIIIFFIILVVTILISSLVGMDNSQVPGNPGFTDYEDFFPNKGDKQ